MRSSYKKNNYGELFEALAKVYQPKLIVECGVLDGYSLISFARGHPTAQIYGIDLFEDYDYKHGNKDAIVSEFWDEGLVPCLDLVHKDVYEAVDDFEDNTIDILHCDISNDGFKLTMFLELWSPKIKKGGLFIFEGGSEERDNVEWMMKYNKTPIQNFKNCLTEKGFEFITLTPFPSLTICRKTK